VISACRRKRCAGVWRQVEANEGHFTTVIGALCFLAGAVGLLVEGTHTRIPARARGG
jgi:hypothetical protein